MQMPALSAWIAEFWPWISLGWALHIAGLSAWIILQKREPVATLSWVLALALLPILGFLVYFLLGPRRIRRARIRRDRARANTPDAVEHEPAPVESGLSRLAQACTAYPPTHCTDIDLLPGGDVAVDTILDAIAKASDHVHLEYYILEPDNTGRQVRDALVERARAGVSVRLLLDAMGSLRLGRRFLRPLREAGVRVAWFHPVALGRLRLRLPRINFRTHRKLVVIDGAMGFLGGVNLCDAGHRRHSASAFHDLHVGLRGEVVSWLQQAFLEDWYYATRETVATAGLWPPQPRGGIRCQVVPSGPDSRWQPFHRLAVSAIHRAERRIWLVTPYFVPSEAALIALTAAAQRGLEVQLLVPRRSDNRLVTWAARSYFGELMRGGVAVYEYLPRMLHTKALLIDDDFALAGSANFDHRSFGLNFELGVMWWDRATTARLETLLSADFAQAERLPTRRRISGLERLKEALARLLSPLM